jgi:hypothetical protein
LLSRDAHKSFRKNSDSPLDISDLDPKQAALRVKQAIEMFESQVTEQGKSEQKDGKKR